MELSDREETPPLDVDNVGDDEDEVDIFLVNSISSAHIASPSGDRSSLNLLAPRRCVSKEMLEQMSTLRINTRYHKVAVCKPFGCFHLMQLIEKSIQVGALFSPKLFIPKEIWQQDRVKLAGVPLKVEVFYQLKQGLEKISLALPLSSDTATAAFVKELDALLEFTRQERVHLTRAFPDLPQEKSNATPRSARGNRGGQEGSNQTPSSGLNMNKLTHLAFGFGCMVKKQAIAAVERVGAAPFVSVSIDELDEYAAVLCMFFNSTRSIENLLGLRPDADGTQEQVSDSKADTQSAPLDSTTMIKLQDLDVVVIELVMRDVHSLLDLYMQRLMRQFGEFTIEQAVLKRHLSVSA